MKLRKVLSRGHSNLPEGYIECCKFSKNEFDTLPEPSASQSANATTFMRVQTEADDRNELGLGP